MKENKFAYKILNIVNRSKKRIKGIIFKEKCGKENLTSKVSIESISDNFVNSTNQKVENGIKIQVMRINLCIISEELAHIGNKNGQNITPAASEN
jgi:hypothetical protein